MEFRNTSARNRFPTNRPNGSGNATITVSIFPERIWVLRVCSVISGVACSYRSAFGNVNVSKFRVTFHGRHPEITADAAMLKTAEGRFDVHAAVRVDA